MSKTTKLDLDLELIGGHLKKVRQLRNEKQETAAKGIGIDRNILSRIEHGTYRCLSLAMLYLILDYYHLDLKDVL